jgi:hypothetical protein
METNKKNLGKINTQRCSVTLTVFITLSQPRRLSLWRRTTFDKALIEMSPYWESNHAWTWKWKAFSLTTSETGEKLLYLVESKWKQSSHMRGEVRLKYLPDMRCFSLNITLMTGERWTVNVWNNCGPWPAAYTVSGCWTMTRTTPDSVPYAISIQLPPLIPTVSKITTIYFYPERSVPVR